MLGNIVTSVPLFTNHDQPVLKFQMLENLNELGHPRIRIAPFEDLSGFFKVHELRLGSIATVRHQGDGGGSSSPSCTFTIDSPGGA